jgi:hypothetical protein
MPELPLADGRDRRYWRRLGVAFACAVALHEIAAGFVPHGHKPVPEPSAIAEVITISTRPPSPTPRPTKPPAPLPTPRSTPQPVVSFAPVPSVAQAGQRAAAPVKHTLGGKAATHAVHVSPPRAAHAVAQPHALAMNDGAGVANGGLGAGGGAGNGDGGAAGTGGSGTGGTGNGSGAGVAPCGVVILVPVPPLQLNRDGSRSVTIRLEVHLSDGSTEEDDLGWKFVYRRESDDPFSKAGTAAGIPVLLQLPPPDYDLEGRQKPATVFAVKHTDRAGYTDLQDCPNR